MLDRILSEADGPQCLFVGRFDPYFEGDEPPGLYRGKTARRNFGRCARYVFALNSDAIYHKWFCQKKNWLLRKRTVSTVCSEI